MNMPESTRREIDGLMKRYRKNPTREWNGALKSAFVLAWPYMTERKKDRAFEIVVGAKRRQDGRAKTDTTRA